MATMMSDVESWRRWRTIRVEARIWWCNDEECYCTQPVIERITPNEQAGYPWIRREVLWSGEHFTNTWEYSAEEREQRQFAPLRAACQEMDISIPEAMLP
jgi:hypothetical protein